MSATKIPAQHVLRRSGDEMKCLYCSYTEPLDHPRSPAQPDASELLRKAKNVIITEFGHDMPPEISELLDGIDAFLRGGSGG